MPELLAAVVVAVVLAALSWLEWRRGCPSGEVDPAYRQEGRYPWSRKKRT